MTLGRKLWRGRARLATVMAVLVVLGIAASAWRAWGVAKQRAWDLAEAEETRAMQTLRAEIGRILLVVRATSNAAVRVAKTLGGLSQLDPEARSAVLAAVTLDGQAYRTTVVLDAQGNTIFDTLQTRPDRRSRADREYFIVHRDNPAAGLHISTPFHAVSDGRWITTVSQAITGPDGVFMGVVATAVELTYLQELFNEARIGPHGSVVLMRTDGVIVARAPFDAALVGRSVAGTPVYAAWRASEGKPFTAITTVDGEERRYVATEFKDVPLVLMVSIATADVRAALGYMPQRIAFGVVVLGGALLLAIWLFRREILARTTAEAEAREGAEILKIIADHSPDVIAIIGPDRRRRFVSKASWRIFGVPPEAMIGKQAGSQSAPEEQEVVKAAFTTVASSRLDSGTAVYRARHADGRTIWVETTGQVIEGTRKNGTYSLVAISRDITAAKEREAALAENALRDELTGLVNRSALQDTLASAMAEQRPVAVIAIDLDHFKEINDAEGHPAGDAVLTAAADRLRGAVRQSDVVARVGGDEFMVLLVGLNDDERLVEIAERISEVLHQPVPWHGKRLRIGATLGIACTPADATTPEEAIQAADEALIRTKREGRGGVGRADSSDADRLSRARKIVRAFRSSEVDTDILGLSVALQPIVRFDALGGVAGEVVALEALTRWQHPEMGAVAPDELFAAIGPEQAFRVGRVVRALALAAHYDLKKRGLSVGRLALNLSAAEVLRPEVVVLIEQQTIEAGLALTDIEIEINEDVLLDRVSDRALEHLSGLRRGGARLSLDDFGTGNSGLSQLLRLPLDALKLDRRFIQRLGQDSRATEIVKATVSLAHGLGLDIVAEGVETTEQADLLQHLGCGGIQGYLVARPMSPENLEHWLGTRVPRSVERSYDPRG